MSERGFTLIEVLVALVIVTIGMSAVLGAMSSSVDTVLYLRDKTFAQWVALNQLANLRLAGQLPPTGTTNGDIDYANRKWHWRQDVSKTEVPGIERIDVRVRSADVKGNEESGWFTTVSGLLGNAVGPPNGYQPDWGVQVPKGTTPQAQTPAGSAAMPTPGAPPPVIMPLPQPSAPEAPPDTPPDTP